MPMPRKIRPNVSCPKCRSNWIISSGSYWRCKNCGLTWKKGTTRSKCKECGVLLNSNNVSGLCGSCYIKKWKKDNVEYVVEYIDYVKCPHCGDLGELDKRTERNKHTKKVHSVSYPISHTVYSPSKYKELRKKGYSVSYSRRAKKRVHCPTLKPHEVIAILGYLP